MRTFLIALAGLAVVGGIGLATIALLPTADGGPLHPIQVNSPENIEPIPPASQTASIPPSATSPPPAQTIRPTQAPDDGGGVPEPPPAIWREDAPQGGDDDWGDDDWGGDDWGGDDSGGDDSGDDDGDDD